MRRVFGAAGAVVALASLWTGWGHGFKATMWGLFPPHYGYSAYIEAAALFLAPWWPVRALLGLSLALSTNRTAWLGVLAGWAYLGGWRRRAACAGLLVLGMLAAQHFKPAGTNAVRVAIWEAALLTLRSRPQGFGLGGWCTGVHGLITPYAHSDVLQVLLVYGVWLGGAVVLWFLAAARDTLRGPKTVEKAALVCLLAQSIPDNRLHRPACQATLFVVAVLALTSQTSRPSRS